MSISVHAATAGTWAAVTVAGLGAVACGAPQTIEIDGSSTVYPITEAVAEEFRNEQPETLVTVGISGTGGGFQRFCRGETDISDASRPIRQPEIDACASRQIEFIELPVAYDGLTVVVNPKNTWATSMTVAELKMLWEPEAEGKVTRWSQIREGWPDREVHLFGAGVDSGTFDYFTEAVVGTEDASRGDFTSSEDDNVLVQGVGGDELALGFFGYAYYAENKTRLKAVAIAEGADTSAAVLPSPETVRDGTYTPLSRPVFIYVRQASLERPEVAQFVEFYLEQGPKLIPEVGYVPLNDTLQALVGRRLEARTTGSAFAAHGGSSRVSLEEIYADQ
ncbi:MAG: phosphate ABC transporter substrate-binding protein PstS family protein [Luteitalea sp.]|nr:phosphate ABC transporter substrate-binding protein PstS family protein [Luteitalea sp.]